MNTQQRAAMQMALEALEVSTDWDVGARGKQLQSMKAITALREALSEQAEQSQLADASLEPVAWMRLNEKSECEAIEYIGNVDEHLYLPPSCQWLYISPVLTMQQVEPKPVAKVGHLHQSIVEACGLPMSTPLYAAPLAKQDTHATHVVRTKDLTDEEIDRALDAANVPELPAGYESIELEIARAVIAADREKNK